MSTVGLLLAAGAGRRMGRPKALVDDWLPATVATLLDGGCAEVIVVLGARADEAQERVPRRHDVRSVVAIDWEAGLSASLRCGLAVAEQSTHTAAVVMLVDLPDVTPPVIARLADGADAASARRAAYDGRPGHPVLLGRSHWLAVCEQVAGDAGAGSYLVAVGATSIDCSDLATGRDVDR